MNQKENLKEKFKQALFSTIKVISDNYKLDKKENKNLSSKNFDFFEFDNLNKKEDYIKLRAETDSEALKIKFSNKKIYQKNLPSNSACRKLYDISEKIRYETIGSKMLKGISKNLVDNYNYKISVKRKDQLKSKDDVPVEEAFELYMMKKFLDIKLNTLSEKVLSYWEKDFESSFEKHLSYLNKNVENQDNYNSKFSEILKQMEIFDSEDDNENKENQDSENLNNENREQENQNQDQGEEEQKKQEESQNGLDSEYDLNEFKMDEQLMDTDSDKQSSEKVIQKMNSKNGNNEYQVFTNQFDEIAKAEILETNEEISKLRKTLDQQLTSFQDLITKLANKLQRQLLAKQNRAWEFDLEEGLLDSSKLTRIIIDPQNSLSFKKEKDLEFKDTVVTLLIDNSG